MFSILPSHSTLSIGQLLGTDLHVDLLRGTGEANTEVAEELRNSGYQCVFGAAYSDEHANKTYMENALPIHTVRLYALEDAMEEFSTREPVHFGQNYVLIQANHEILRSDLEDGISTLTQKGYQPVLVQAERYICLQDNYRNIPRLTGQGCLLTSEMVSLTGEHGTEAKRLAQKLFKEEHVSFASTGAQNIKQQKKVNELFQSKKMIKQLQSPKIKNKELRPVPSEAVAQLVSP